MNEFSEVITCLQCGRLKEKSKAYCDGFCSEECHSDWQVAGNPPPDDEKEPFYLRNWKMLLFAIILAFILAQCINLAEGNDERVLVIGEVSRQQLLLCDTLGQMERVTEVLKAGDMEKAFAEVENINRGEDTLACSVMAVVLKLVDEHGKFTVKCEICESGERDLWIIEVLVIGLENPSRPNAPLPIKPFTQFTYSVFPIVSKESNKGNFRKMAHPAGQDLDKPIVYLGESAILDENTRSCWTEESALITLASIEMMSYRNWSDTFDQIARETGDKFCTRGRVSVTFLEKIGRGYTDSDGDVWNIIKSKPHSFGKHYKHPFVFLILPLEVKTEEEHELFHLFEDAIMV